MSHFLRRLRRAFDAASSATDAVGIAVIGGLLQAVGLLVALGLNLAVHYYAGLVAGLSVVVGLPLGSIALWLRPTGDLESRRGAAGLAILGLWLCVSVAFVRATAAW